MLTGGLFLSLVTSWFPLGTPSGKIPFSALILSVQLHSELTPRVCPQGRWPCTHCSPFSSPWSGPGTPFQVGCPARAVPFSDLEVLTLGPSSGASASMALTTLCGHALSVPGPRQCPLAPNRPCASLWVPLEVGGWRWGRLLRAKLGPVSSYRVAHINSWLLSILLLSFSLLFSSSQLGSPFTVPLTDISHLWRTIFEPGSKWQASEKKNQIPVKVGLEKGHWSWGPEWEAFLWAGWGGGHHGECMNVRQLKTQNEAESELLKHTRYVFLYFHIWSHHLSPYWVTHSVNLTSRRAWTRFRRTWTPGRSPEPCPP